MNFEVGQEKTLTLKGGNFSGISFNHYLTGATDNVAIDTYPAVDWSEINVSIICFQDGLKETIYSGKLLQLLIAQKLNDSDYTMISENATGHSNIVRRAAASSVKELSSVGVNFDFGTVINLRGADRIEVNIDMDTDTYQAKVDSTSSYMDVEGIVGVGVQTMIPKFFAKPITDNDDNRFGPIASACRWHTQCLRVVRSLGLTCYLHMRDNQQCPILLTRSSMKKTVAPTHRQRFLN